MRLASLAGLLETTTPPPGRLLWERDGLSCYLETTAVESTLTELSPKTELRFVVVGVDLEAV